MQNDKFYELKVSQNLFNGFKDWHEYRLNNLGYENAKIDLKEEEEETIDDKTANLSALVLLKAFKGADDLGKHTAAINIGHQQNRGMRIGGHPEINNIMGHQINFCT